MSRVPGLDLAPGDRVVLIRIEPEREVEIAERDVPLPVDPCRRSTLEREVAVRRLVRVRRCRRHAPSSIASTDEPELHFAALRCRRSTEGRDRRILESRLGEPSPDDVAWRQHRRPPRRLRRGCAGPPARAAPSSCRARAPARSAASPRKRELEARVLALVHGVAAGAACLEARAQRLDRRRGFRPSSRRVARARAAAAAHRRASRCRRARSRRPRAAGRGANRCTRPGDTGLADWRRAPRGSVRSAAGSPRRCAISPSSVSAHARPAPSMRTAPASVRRSVSYAGPALPVTLSIAAVQAAA